MLLIAEQSGVIYHPRLSFSWNKVIQVRCICAFVLIKKGYRDMSDTSQSASRKVIAQSLTMDEAERLCLRHPSSPRPRA